MTPTMAATRNSRAQAYPVLPAEELGRARTFYHDILGFDVVDMPEARQFVLRAGDGTGAVVYETARTKAEHTVATFVVSDLSATMDELRSRGIEFEEYDLPGLKTINGVAELPGEESAWFTDTEGNVISLAHMS